MFYLSYCHGEALFGGGWFERGQDPPLVLGQSWGTQFAAQKPQLILRALPYCSGMWNIKCELKVHCRCINYFYDIMVAIQVFPTCSGHSDSRDSNPMWWKIGSNYKRRRRELLWGSSGMPLGKFCKFRFSQVPFPEFWHHSDLSYNIP